MKMLTTHHNKEFEFEEINLNETFEDKEDKEELIKYSQTLSTCVFAILIDDQITYYTKNRDDAMKFIKIKIDNYKTNQSEIYKYEKVTNRMLGYGEVTMNYKCGLTKPKKLVSYRIITLPEVTFST